MADETLSLQFTGDTRQLVQAMRDLERVLQRFSRTYEQVQTAVVRETEKTTRARVRADADVEKSLNQRLAIERKAEAAVRAQGQKNRQERIRGDARVAVAQQATAQAAQKRAATQIKADAQVAVSAQRTAQTQIRADAQVATSAQNAAARQAVAAAKVQQAQIRLQAQTQRLAAAQQRATTRMRKGIGQADKILVNPLGRARKAILDLRTAMILLGGAAGGQQIIGFASEFEKSLANLSTLLDKNATVSIGRYRQQLDLLARQSPKELIDLTQGLYQTISAGIPVIEGGGGAFDVLTQAQRAAVAGLSSTEQAVGSFTTILNAYSGSGLTASDVSDKLFQTVRKGRTVFPELAESVGRVATVAARAGVGIDELLAAVVSLTKAGLSTDEAVTQLRRLILGLIKPSKEVAEQFTSLGVDFGETALRAKGLVGILEEVNRVTGGSTDAFAQLFPNVRAMVGAVVLGTSGIDDFRRSIDYLKSSTGATDDAYEKITDTFDTTFKVFKSRLQAVMINVGDRVLPQLRRAFVRLGDILEKNEPRLGKIVEGFFKFSEAVATFLIKYAPQIIAFFTYMAGASLLRKLTLLFGVVKTGILEFGTAFGTSAKSQKGFFASLAAGLKNARGGLHLLALAITTTIVFAFIDGLDQADQEARKRAAALRREAAITAAIQSESAAVLSGFSGGQEQRAALFSGFFQDPNVVIITVKGDVDENSFKTISEFLNKELIQQTADNFGITFERALGGAVDNIITATQARTNNLTSNLEALLARVTQARENQEALERKSAGDDVQDPSDPERDIPRTELIRRLRDRELDLTKRIQLLRRVQTAREKILRSRREELRISQAQKKEAETLFDKQRREAEEAERAAELDKARLQASQQRGRLEAVSAAKLSRAAKERVQAADAEIARIGVLIERLDRAAAKEKALLEARGAPQEEIDQAAIRVGAERLGLLADQQQAVRALVAAEKERVRVEEENAKKALLRRLINERLSAKAEAREKAQKVRVASEALKQTRQEILDQQIKAKLGGEEGRNAEALLEKLQKQRKAQTDELNKQQEALGLFVGNLSVATKEEQEALDAQLEQIRASSALVALQERLRKLTQGRLAEEEALLNVAKRLDVTIAGQELGAGRELSGPTVNLPELEGDALLRSFGLTEDAVQEAERRGDDIGEALKKGLMDALGTDVVANMRTAVGALVGEGTIRVGEPALLSFDEAVEKLEAADEAAKSWVDSLQEAADIPAPAAADAMLPDEETVQEYMERALRGVDVSLEEILRPDVFPFDTFGKKLRDALRLDFFDTGLPEGLDITASKGEIFARKLEAIFLDTVIPAMRDSLVEVFETVGEFDLGNIFGGIKNTLGSLLDAAVQPVTRSLDDIVPGLGSAIQPLIDGLMAISGRFLDSIVGPIDKALSAPLELLLGSFDDAVDVLIGFTRDEAGRAQAERREEYFQQRQKLLQENASRKELVDALREYQKDRREMAREALDTRPSTVLQKGADDAEKVLNRVVTELPGILEEFIDILLEKTPRFFEKLSDAIDDIFTRATERLEEVLKVSEDATGKLVGRLFETLRDNLVKIVKELLEESLSRIGSRIPKIIGGIVVLILKLVQGIFEGLPEFLERLVSGLAEGIVWAVREILQALPGLLTSIVKGLLNGVASLLKSLGPALAELIEGLIDGITDFLMEGLPDLISGLVTALIEGIPALLEGLATLLVSIFTDVLPKLIEGLGGLVEELVKGIAKLLKWLILELPQAIYDGVDELFEELGETLGINWDLTEGGEMIVASAGFTGDLGGAFLMGGLNDIFSKEGLFSTFHKGGRVGAGERKQGLASALAASGAQSFQMGGLVLPDIGAALRSTLMRDEAPAVLQVGEGVLNREAMMNIGGAGNLERLNKGDGPQQVFGPGQPIQATVNIRPSGNAVMDALANMLLQSAAVSMTTPGGLLRAAQRRGTLPGTKNVRGRD